LSCSVLEVVSGSTLPAATQERVKIRTGDYSPASSEQVAGPAR
jgi:hypothetical protein